MGAARPATENFSIVRRLNVMVSPNASHGPKTARGRNNHQIVTLTFQIYEFFESALICHPMRVSDASGFK
jgi:hypothetical protein